MTSFLRKAKDKFDQSQAAHREQSAHRANYAAAVERLAAPGADVKGILASLPDSGDYNGRDLQAINDRAFTGIIEAMLADDVLDETEETNLVAAAGALGITPDRMNADFKPLLERMVVARVNDGRLPVLDAADVRIRLTAGELCHLTTNASLMKWEAVKEWQGRNNGFSFRVAKGVYYRTGQTRGHIVTTGQKLAIEDTGVLTVTSKRAVFTGSRKALEFDYRKLLDIEVFSDGIKLAVSNRQNPSLMRTDAAGDTVAAVINAAAGKN